MAADTSTQGVVRRILIPILVVSLVVGAGGAYYLLRYRALETATKTARLMLTTALAIRGYINDRVQVDLPQFTAEKFHQATVPSFAAQTVYRQVQTGFPAYSYREPALNPTSPSDRATPFEVELINRFRADPDLPEIRGVRDSEDGSVFYLAKPIKITQETCLQCHGAPQRAPPSMVAFYGRENGFNWRLNEVVGVQTMTVPVEHELRGAVELAAMIAGGLLLVFFVTYWALTSSLNIVLVRPLVALARAADSASRKAEQEIVVPPSGASEIRTLGEAIERLRVSLSKAMDQLGASRPADKG
ncbi:MAG TPA: DUF3365 domain-containing protein [Xanthobacteraceae bacterium]|nr:DUF3365 domain-containing protein [Xanthobacteraceae bacterium]